MTDEPLTPAEMGAKGGKARAQKMTPEERSERARAAVQARWAKEKGEFAVSDIPSATHGSPDHPLRIADLEIPCYVLSDKRRLLVQRGMVSALGLSRGSSGGTGGDRLAKFVAGDRLKPFVSENLIAVTQSPIKFKTLAGALAYGYEATILADICDAVLAARAAGALQQQQEHIATRCELLMRGFARVGIIALVDEATGFQYDRPRRELAEYLRKFLAESLTRYVSTFPADYFKHLCRLRNVQLREDMRLPPYFGTLTNNLVYRRIAPGLLRALKDRREERGKASNKLYWWTSNDVGYPALLMHLGTVTGLMKIHTEYKPFEKQLDEVAPIYPETPGLFDNPADWQEPG